MVVGVGAVTKSSKIGNLLTKVTKPITAYSKRLKKIARVKINCIPCAKFFSSTRKLRKNLLSKDNIAETKRLLNSEWKKSGKKWNVFIKDYDAHHVIPADLLDESKALKFYFNNGGKLKFNSVENGIFVKKLRFGKGVHANHPDYNFSINEKLTATFEKIERLNIDNSAKVKILDKKLSKLISDTKNEILKESIHGNKKINQIFD